VLKAWRWANNRISFGLLRRFVRHRARFASFTTEWVTGINDCCNVVVPLYNRQSRRRLIHGSVAGSGWLFGIMVTIFRLFTDSQTHILVFRLIMTTMNNQRNRHAKPHYQTVVYTWQFLLRDVLRANAEHAIPVSFVSLSVSSVETKILPHHSTVTIALTYNPGAILPIKVKGRRCSRAYCYQ